MYFLSSAEGVRWSEIATEMTERIRELGPNPLREGSDQ
jgi:coenzyme F420-reducing hydrogenase delta subunit